jgi:hypothetical protein
MENRITQLIVVYRHTGDMSAGLPTRSVPTLT